MNKLILFIFALCLAACQGSDNGNGGNTTTVITPLSMSCINGSAYCNNTQYAQSYGFIPYPGLYTYAYDYTNQFAQYGFCNCPSGYQPVYNASYGLGCVNTQLLQPYEGYYYSMQWGWSYVGAAPQTTINIPQVSNIAGATHGRCTRTLTQSCLLDQGNTCGAGATCRQVLQGSNLGVCMNY